MSQFIFGGASRNRLTGVHPDLVEVAYKALGYGVMDFAVAQGVRTEEEQRKLYAKGRTEPGPIVTWTMNSNHLLKEDGYGHAIDIVPFINGKTDWQNEENFAILATLMFRAAMELGVQIGWGGHWRKNIDRPHFELVKGD